MYLCISSQRVLAFSVLLTTVFSTTLTKNVNGTQIDWFWPSDESNIPTYKKCDLVNVSWSTTTQTMPELLTVCSQAGSANSGPNSNGWVQSIGYHIVDLNLFIGPSRPYSCHFDFRDLNGNTFNTPSASFYIADSTSADVVRIHSENNQTLTITSATSSSSSTASPSATASSSASSSSSIPPTPTTTTTSSSSSAQNGSSPGTVAGIVVGVVAALSLIAGLVAFFCVRDARRRRGRNQSEQQMPLWQQKYQRNGLGVTEMGAGHATATVLEKDGVGQMAEVSGSGSRSVGELEAGGGVLGRPQQARGWGRGE